jgi:hypothetical protein
LLLFFFSLSDLASPTAVDLLRLYFNIVTGHSSSTPVWLGLPCDARRGAPPTAPSGHLRLHNLYVGRPRQYRHPFDLCGIIVRHLVHASSI